MVPLLFTNRTQTCLVNGNKSSKMFLRYGVPQGTILGPLLFLLYINDLPNCQPRMYADDTSITFAGSDVDEMNNCINLDLERIRVWLAANKLTLRGSSAKSGPFNFASDKCFLVYLLH